MPNRDGWAFLAWLVVLGLGLHFGPALAPFVEGPALAMLGWVLGLVWAWFLAICARLWFGLDPARRRRSLPWLPPLLAGLFLVAWAQPLLMERLHVVLFGVVGLLAYRLFRARPAGWPRLRPALLLSLAVGLADELAQALHPLRVGDWRDVITDALSAGLLILICALLDPQDDPVPAKPKYETTPENRPAGATRDQAQARARSGGRPSVWAANSASQAWALPARRRGE